MAAPLISGPRLFYHKKAIMEQCAMQGQDGFMPLFFVRHLDVAEAFWLPCRVIPDDIDFQNRAVEAKKFVKFSFRYGVIDVSNI